MFQYKNKNSGVKEYYFTRDLFRLKEMVSVKKWEFSKQ